MVANDFRSADWVAAIACSRTTGLIYVGEECQEVDRVVLGCVQAFITTTQGAIFRRAVKGMSGLPAWQILKQGWGDNWKVIGQMQHRPSSQDLEMAFLNASAAESPITAGIKAVKGLVPGKKD